MSVVRRDVDLTGAVELAHDLRAPASTCAASRTRNEMPSPVSLTRQVRDDDALGAHLAADGVDQVGQALAHHGLGVDLEQQVRAALQVEAEIDLLLGQPGRQRVEPLAREQVRHGIEDADHANAR